MLLDRNLYGERVVCYGDCQFSYKVKARKCQILKDIWMEDTRNTTTKNTN